LHNKINSNRFKINQKSKNEKAGNMF
jgi:hypothetical protein